MFLVDTLHQHGIGVILDWVPSHFPTDAHGLGYFDGTHLYEHADPRQGFHPDWEQLHLQLRPQRGAQLPPQQRALLARALPRRRPARGRRRVDALPRLLAPRGRVDPEPLRRSREPRGDRLPAPLQRARLRAPARRPDRRPRSRRRGRRCRGPTYLGGLGFGFKWDMGWMHDTLDYMATRAGAPEVPPHRAHVPHACTPFTENFVLPLSHDEVVHGKGSLIGKMPGDRLAALREPAPAARLHVDAQPGKKLLFMGGELGAVARSGTTTPASTGTCSSSRRTPASSAGCAT